MKQPISQILQHTTHRPWPLPDGNWQYYQEWNHAIFLHFPVSYTELAALVPAGLTLDHFEGQYYVSLVAFTMEAIRPRSLPPLSFLSDFHEINVRTYIEQDGKKGVYFLNIEAEKQLSAWVARSLSGLPYETAQIHRSEGRYQSRNPGKGYKLDVHFERTGSMTQKSPLDIWLTERYCLYMHQGPHIYRYDIHHAAWELEHIQIQQADISYIIGDLQLQTGQWKDAHYSKGVQVISWPKKRLE